MDNGAGYNPKATRWSLGLKLKRVLWTFVNQTIFRYSPFACYGWRRLLLRMFGAKIASTATISRTVEISSPWNLEMGENSMIGHHSWVMCSGKVSIGCQCTVGEYVKILAGSHNVRSKSYKPVTPGVDVRDHAWVATGAMLVSAGARDLRVGEGAVVAAGAVVFSNVRKWTIVVGNPAEYLTDRVLDQE